MAEENKLTQKYEFKSKINLNTKNTNIAKQAEMVSTDKYNQNWLNRRIQEQDLPYLPLNILQNNIYEPEEQEKSNYTNNNTINNVTSNITNYNMQANFKAIDNIKKNYLVNKYIENNVFHTNITRGDIISAKNIAIANWHLGSPNSYVNNENVTENLNFKQAVQSVNQDVKTINVLQESYQKLKEEVEQISNTANINSIFRNEENIRSLNLAVNNLSNTVLKSDVLLELSAQYKKDKKIFYKLNKVIKSDLDPIKQLNSLFDVKNNIVPKVKKSALILLLRSIKQQLEVYNESREINKEERERIDRQIEERLGIIQRKENVLEEKELRRKLQLRVVRRIEREEKRESEEHKKEERERVNRQIEERFVKILDKENKILKKTIETRVKKLSDIFSKKNILNITEGTVIEPITKLIFKEDNINFENALTNQKDITRYREILGRRHIILNAARDHFNNVIEKEIFLVAQKNKKVRTRTYNRDIKEVFISHKNDDATEKLETIFKKVFEQVPINNKQQIALSEDITEKTKYNSINTKNLQKSQDKQMDKHELNNMITQKIDDNIPDIADKVYAAIDNKLKTERYRMGLF